MTATKPYVVALTGGIGSGKSTVAQGFQALGIECVDADLIAHELTAPGGAALPAIRARFGDVLADSGALDRDRMRELVFADDDKRLQLEAILHPMIGELTVRRLGAVRSPYALWVVPLFFESKRQGARRAQRVLVVDCSEASQVRRVMARSGLSEAAVLAIMARQVPRAVRLEGADDIIDNEQHEEHLQEQIARLHARYLELAQNESS